MVSPVFWGWRCHNQVVSHYNFLLSLCIKQWIKKFDSNRHLNFTVIVEIFFLPAICLHLYGSSSFTIHNNLPTIVTKEQETICLHLGCCTDLNSEQHFANRSSEYGECWYLHSVPICKWVDRWFLKHIHVTLLTYCFRWKWASYVETYLGNRIWWPI